MCARLATQRASRATREERRLARTRAGWHRDGDNRRRCLASEAEGREASRGARQKGVWAPGRACELGLWLPLAWSPSVGVLSRPPSSSRLDAIEIPPLGFRFFLLPIVLFLTRPYISSRTYLSPFFSPSPGLPVHPLSTILHDPRRPPWTSTSSSPSPCTMTILKISLRPSTPCIPHQRTIPRATSCTPRCSSPTRLSCSIRAPLLVGSSTLPYLLHTTEI